MNRMPDGTSTLARFRDACQTLLSRYNDFWLLATLTDRSYEDGQRSRFYKRFVETYSALGIPEVLVDQLKAGINGNLEAELRQHFSEVRRNQGPGQDFELDSSSDNPATVEVKMIWDHTFPKYFAEIGKDRTKLIARKEQGFTGACYQAVFFLQMPNYRYPGGAWPDGKHYKERGQYTKKLGVESCIAAQWSYLQGHLHARPRWPSDNGPYVRELDFPTEIVTEDLLVRWFDSYFRPDASWRFDNPRDHLKDAAVGVCIWEY